MNPIDRDWLLDFIKFDEKVIAPEEHTAQDIVMMIQTAPTITLPPNDPLTLEELREMDGEPVYIVDHTWLNLSAWGIVSVFNGADWKKAHVYISRGQKGTVTYPDQEYGNCWLAYRRKPEDAHV